MKKINLLASLTAVLVTLLSGFALAGKDDKVTICHLTHSESNPFVIISVPEKTAYKHIAMHGDYFYDGISCELNAQDPEDPTAPPGEPPAQDPNLPPIE